MKFLSTFSNSFMKMSVKQKITVMICFMIVTVGAILAIYQLLPSSTEKEMAEAEDKTVTIQAITDQEQNNADTLANTNAEVMTVEATTQDTNNTQVVSNATTVDTSSTTDDIYIAEDGAHYESEPVYADTTEDTPYEEPVSSDTTADSGWDGNLGGDTWDTTGSENFGSGISN